MTRTVNTAVSIGNMALAHLGILAPIHALDENTTNARAVNLFYGQARDEVLGAFGWPFTRKYATLALVAGTASVPANPDWQYTYRYPTDCFRARRIWNGARNESRETRVPFAIGQDADGGLIMTDWAPLAATATSLAEPQLEYSVFVEDPGRFPVDFAQAVACLLAAYMAPAITGGDKFQLGRRALALYQSLIAGAENDAANEEQPDVPPDAELITARGG